MMVTPDFHLMMVMMINLNFDEMKMNLVTGKKTLHKENPQ